MRKELGKNSFFPRLHIRVELNVPLLRCNNVANKLICFNLLFCFVLCTDIAIDLEVHLARIIVQRYKEKESPALPTYLPTTFRQQV